MTYQKTELKRAKARVGQPDGRASRGQGAEARVVVVDALRVCDHEHHTVCDAGVHGAGCVMRGVWYVMLGRVSVSNLPPPPRTLFPPPGHIRLSPQRAPKARKGAQPFDRPWAICVRLLDCTTYKRWYFLTLYGARPWMLGELLTLGIERVARRNGDRKTVGEFGLYVSY